ncbi:MAG: hypothetical protein KBS91_04265 [Firmicutes bacterium]|nr:hypothetical protein [Candidatus Caballimonas caccae]
MAKYRKTEFSLKDRAKMIGAERKLLKLIPIIMGCIAVLCSLVYVVSVMYSKFGDFTVAIQKFQYMEYGLSLSETSDFRNPTSSLDCRASEIITNIAGESLDKIDLGANDGNDSGENYLCYTFYLKNAGTEAVSFDYSIVINERSMGIEKAVRVRLITSINGGEKKTTTYAAPSSNKDANGEFLPEVGTTKFYTNSTVCLVQQDGFQHDDVMKFTVVIWLEGPDDQCLDNIIGGQFKIDMKFNILGGAENEE